MFMYLQIAIQGPQLGGPTNEQDQGWATLRIDRLQAPSNDALIRAASLLLSNGFSEASLPRLRLQAAW